MHVELDQVLLTSVRLGDIGDVYADVVAQLKSISEGDAAKMFETGGISSAYTTAINTLWTYCADSQDNLNASAAVLVHYINAVCEQDGAAADDLKTEAAAIDSSMDSQESENGLEDGTLGSRPPEVNDNPTEDDPAVDLPEDDKAERPGT